MAFDRENPLNMIPDPYTGDLFVFSETFCTDQRRSWYRRSNEIISFLLTTELALKECKDKYQQLLSQGTVKLDTPLRLQSSDGRAVIMPTQGFLNQCINGIDILCRQVFVMFYGSLETFIFELLEKSFHEIGVNKDILGSSLEIMMRKKWDGRFCKMNDVFGLNYKASDLINHFDGFELSFDGQVFKNPLLFLDELSQIRHRIIHASSMLEKGRLIFLNVQVFSAYYVFCAHLTDYIDQLFVTRFNFLRLKIQPAQA